MTTMMNCWRVTNQIQRQMLPWIQKNINTKILHNFLFIVNCEMYNTNIPLLDTQNEQQLIATSELVGVAMGWTPLTSTD